MILGAPFTIGDTTWTPSDQLNYDAVGYAAVATQNYAGVTAAHKTLPLPGYVEVTSLDTGRTILLRIERRGPMANGTLIELSPEAARQLGIDGAARVAVRLRRTNPPEQERALLRQGNRAPERMATPEGLLKALRRRLTEQSPLLPEQSKDPAKTQPTTRPSAAQPPAVQSAPQAEPHASTPKGALIVQAGAFSVQHGADKVARQLGGSVTKPGKFWLVRIGPFANRAQAAAALEKARAAGYRDARIQRAD